MIRIGVVGTGYWAEQVHLPVLRDSDAVELVGVWGRRAETTRPLAERLGIASFATVDDLFGAVDAVSFAVPPDVQAELALRAARSGKHLLLEKPIALAAGPAHSLAAAVRQAGVAAVVFLTRVFTADVERQIQSLAAAGPWRHCQAHFRAGALRQGSPYAGSAWRQAHGALWDLGPHLLSVLLPIMGEVTRAEARHGEDGAVSLSLSHAPGGRTEASLSLQAPPERQGEAYALDDGAARLHVPPAPRQQAYAACLASLLAMAGGARDGDSRYGAATGAQMVAILEQAQRTL